MRKILIFAFVFSFLIQTQSFSLDIGNLRNIFYSNAIEQAVDKIDTTNSDPITAAIVNKAKINALKKQLELQQQELADVEASSDFFLIKWYRKKQINDKIADIEEQIRVLEGK